MSETDPAWQFFAVLQDKADSPFIDQSIARDEALDVVLDEIVNNPTMDQELLRKRFYSLCRNRLTKCSNRRALDRRRFRSTHRRAGSDLGSGQLTTPQPTILDQLADNQLAGQIRAVLAEEELRLLMEIADGYSYAEIARKRSMTVSGLKSKAFRVREKLRWSGFSRALRCVNG